MMAAEHRSSIAPTGPGTLLLELDLPASMTYRSVALSAVSAACKVVAGAMTCSDPIEFEQQVVSAVGEAFNNTVLHAYDLHNEGRVTISMEVASNELLILVIDNGASFDLATVPDPELAEVRESGMGVFIMRSFMDEVAYRPGPPNVLSLRKVL